MAFLHQPMAYPMRSMSINKEPDWSTVYDELFSQYIDTDVDNFGCSDNTDYKETTDSDDSNNAVAVSSTSSCIFGSSPPTNWSAKDIEQDFWTKTLQSLEDSANCVEQNQQIASAQQQPEFNLASHSDFLSLGGFPSPHISSPQSPSEAARRRKATHRQARQTSRGRSPRQTGVKKNPSRGRSPRMMSPSRFRAGHFKDVWAEKSAKGSYNISLPIRSAPLSPPNSAKMGHAVDSATFCSPEEIYAASHIQNAFYDEEVSPTSEIHQRQQSVYTPDASPLTTPGVEQLDFALNTPEDIMERTFGQRSMYYAVPPTAAQSNRSSWITEPDEDNCLPSPTFNPWAAGNESNEPQEHILQLPPFEDIIAPYNTYPSATIPISGLGITCDPTFTTADYSDADFSALSTDTYPFSHDQTQNHGDLFRTPSPSPQVPRSAPRSTPRRSKNRSRRTTPTSASFSPRGASSSSFVNFTPSDSAKLLKGVAPSGSSKTKARREKEAADKRRKFSQAAVSALQEAGGDLERLRDVLL